MNFHRAFSFSAVFLALFFLASGAQAKDEWIKLRSKNFQLFGNASREEIRQVAVKMEKFREAFRQISGKESLGSPIPTNIIVFENEESFRDYQPASREEKFNDPAISKFQGGEDVNYIALSIKGDKIKTFRTIFHEHAHFLFDNNFGRANTPAWLNEGLAEYYETAQIEDDRNATLGAQNDEHLRLLRQNKPIPLETFFGFNYYSLNLRSEENVRIFYAQAWALIHYLLHGKDGARNGQFNKFVGLLQNGKPSKEALREAFQVDFAALEREMAEYIFSQKTFGTIVLTQDKLRSDDEKQSSPLKKAEARAILGDLLFYKNRLETAAGYLEEALKLDADESLANSTLGLVRMRQKNFAEAKKYLEKAVKLDEKNYLAHYRYAYALSREGMSEYGFVSGYDFESAEKMRGALKKAMALNPNFAPSYDLYAFISLVRNEEIAKVEEYLDMALALAPGNQWFQLRSAETYMRREDFTNARRIALKVFQSAPTEEIHIYAQNRINFINSLEAQLLALRNYDDRLRNEVPDKILTDEEFARLRELAILESINKGLRKPRTNEIRVLGYLTKIECGEYGIEYFVKVNKNILKLRSKDFENLTLVSFAREMNNANVGCETIKNEIFAVITYQPNKNQTADGEILSIEFVPQNFKFLK